MESKSMREYQTLSQLKRSGKGFGLSYHENLEMAYENLRTDYKILTKKLSQIQERMPSVDELGFEIFKNWLGLSEKVAREFWTGKHHKNYAKEKSYEVGQVIHKLYEERLE